MPNNLPRYSAYIPAYNASRTLGRVIESLLAQSVPPSEFVIVDNGSRDQTRAIAVGYEIPVLRLPVNRGRGAARARAIELVRHDFVLCCDATVRLAPDFAERGLSHFTQNSKLAALTGVITQAPGGNLAHRWRGRHLFLGRPGTLQTNAPHNTGAAIVRRAAVLAVGNYDPKRAAHEDSDLGERLRVAGSDIWCDPAMVAEALVENTLAEVFERYARWYEPRERGWSWRDYPRNLRQALRIHLRDDLAARDVPAALASLLLPQYLLWYGCCHKHRKVSPPPAQSAPTPAAK